MNMTYRIRGIRGHVTMVAFGALALVGCKKDSGFLSQTDSPDASGTWNVDYDDTLVVEVQIGGATYTNETGLQGGKIEFTHNGQPITLDLDCSHPAIVCPSEQYPETVSVRHKDARYPHHFHMTIPTQECMGMLVEPAVEQCGQGTDNPECKKICDGEITVTDKEAFGLIDEPGERMSMLLGGGIVTNGINCALLGISGANADVISTGEPDEDWQAVAMQNGEIVVGYAGRCLWAGDPDDDGSLEALLVGANVRISTGFSATKAL